jgi:hypothetical protein
MEEIFGKVDKIFPELIELLRRKKPELIPLYEGKYECTKEMYPINVRLHNAYEILRTYIALKGDC